MATHYYNQKKWQSISQTEKKPTLNEKNYFQKKYYFPVRPVIEKRASGFSFQGGSAGLNSTESRARTTRPKGTPKPLNPKL